MNKAAWLVKVFKPEIIRQKIGSWTDDVDRIINSVLSGKEEKVTTRNCENCKADLEKDDASQVEIK